MQALDKDLRSALEKTVKTARTVAETAAHAAVEQLGVGHDKPEAFLSDAEKALRNRLRTHGKQLGDARDSKSANPTYGKQSVRHLVQEVAYEHWHRMLFARFLADNNLLMYDGVAVTIEECDELAPDEDAKSGWELAGKLAARMLPQVFKPGSPVFELTFAPEHQSELERLLQTLPDAVFKASDSLGWVYQFWQADNKERINKSEVKIGADELPAVTQLFTEPYMVAFLLHNSLGAWWAARHPSKPCPVNLDYFRTLEDGTPASGKFEGWPDSLADFKLLDPCCGSGHFLVAAFLTLVPMRMVAEDLSAKEAVNRVLAENIHGLEIDPRCVEIAVFAVALEAWRYPDVSGRPLGVREIPAPNIACCGLKVAAKVQDWEALVPDEAPNAEYVRQELRQLHASFSEAPLLGSLLNPSRNLRNDLATSNFKVLTDLLHRALETERSVKLPNEVDDRWELALSAQGLLEAARLLDDQYHLVITNVPYLGAGKQSDSMRQFVESNYPDGKVDLANVFLERCNELARHENGVIQLVMPQSWLLQARSETQRRKLLNKNKWLFLTLLGGGGDAFEKGPGNIVSIIFITLAGGASMPADTYEDAVMSGIDVSEASTPMLKSIALKHEPILQVDQDSLINNIGAKISFHALSKIDLLSDVAHSVSGMKTGDVNRFNRCFWEVSLPSCDWCFIQQNIGSTNVDGGREEIIFWQNGQGQIKELADSVRGTNHVAQNWRRGQEAWGKKGVAITAMGDIYIDQYFGEIFDSGVTVVYPKKGKEYLLPAIYSLCISDYYKKEVRKIDNKLSITTSSFVKVPFDIAHWTSIANENFSEILPIPISKRADQWIFPGNPKDSNTPLQVAVARLVGFVWPAERDKTIILNENALPMLNGCKALSRHADTDGIVCIPSLGSESSASDRLLNLLADAYGNEWTNDILAQLLSNADHAGKSLESWLRDKFFTQHCAQFGNRPFIWHVWDGLRDGFAALVNYHKLDYKALEALIYTYLGDWIGRQKRDADNVVDGAQEKLAAAETLKKRLELILAGDAPYDIFVRWKPIEEQPIGWNPDMNDGVRLNIRPFLAVPDLGKRGAGVLRDKPSIKWEKDRGSDVPSAPWYELGLQYGGKVGDRINDHHLALVEKRTARAEQ